MQRMLLFVAATLLVVLAAAGGANATHSEGTGPGKDLVAGTGQIDVGPIDVFVHVNAMSGPSGEDPGGHLVFHGAPPATPFPIDIQGRITCMRVAGNRATVGFEITMSKEPGIPVGFGGIFSFTDNGEPGDNDQFEGFPVPVPPTVCPLLLATRTATQGNFIVHDASP